MHTFTKTESTALLNILYTYESESRCLYLSDQSIAPNINLQPLLNVSLEDSLKPVYSGRRDAFPELEVSKIACSGELSSVDEEIDALASAYTYLRKTFPKIYNNHYYARSNSSKIDWTCNGNYNFDMLDALKELKPLFDKILRDNGTFDLYLNL